MTNWLVHTFIKDYKQTQDDKVRFHYGVLATIVGILCNVILFLIKVVAGTYMHSVSIISDGFNNLSDSLSCLITLVGYKVASKPADEQHPFGHGRAEYIVSFISCIIIFVVIYELLSESISKIFHPEQMQFHNILFIVLLASILIKMWLAKFNHTLGNQLNNLAMKTASQDARNDVFTTLLSIIAMVLACAYPTIPFDGVGGVILSIFLFYAAYGMAKEVINALLGNPVDPTLAKEIETVLLKDPHISGVHDLMIHEYGPNTHFGEAHVEMDASLDMMHAHDIVDEAERTIQKEYHVKMTIHMDPIEKDTPRSIQCKKIVLQTLQQLDTRLTMHDFRFVTGKQHINLIFDIVVPFTCAYTNEQIQQAIQQAFSNETFKTHLHITFDHNYIAGE